MLTRELAGDFVNYLYNNGFILGNRVASRTFVQRKFRAFLVDTHQTLGAFDNDTSLDAILKEFGFIWNTISDEKIYKFDFRTLFRYRNEMIAELDEKEIQNANKAILSTEDFNTTNFLEDKPKILDDFPCYELIFQFRLRQTINEHFILSSKGCYCCQLNFKKEDEYGAHIDYHSQESDFEYRSQYEKKDDILPQQFTVTYKLCENSHLLFSIKALKDENIIIEKIIVFRTGTVHYLEDALVPYFLPSDGSNFYVNCHIFQIAYEQPLMIVFKLKNDPKDVRYVEEHHFLRFDVFPANLNLKTKHVFRRGEMQFKQKIQDFLPTPVAKAMHLSEFDEKSHPIKRTVRDFIKKVATLNDGNICDVFELLVEMEDFALSKVYEKFSRKGVRVEGCASDYSLMIVKPPENQMPETVFSRGDRVILVFVKTPNDAEKRKYGMITSVIGNRVYFESKCGKIPIDLIYDVSFEPQRLNFIYQQKALQQLRGDIYLRARLFPENSIGNLPLTLSLEYFNSNIAENPEQREAVQNIIGNNNKHVPFVIFGPPGTGKTTLIVEAILQLWKKSKDYRVLVLAGSNAACDEVASRLCKIFNDIDPTGMNLLRIYATSYESKSENINEDVLEASNLCYGQHFYPALETIYFYPIVVATLSVAGRLVHAQIKNNHFTHVFIDECGASTEPECLMGLSGILSSSGHLIVSGDPKQLGPIIECQRAANYGLGKSLMERLMDRECYQQHPITKEYNRSIQARLVRNFRSHKDIISLPNQLYYNNELKVMASPDITDIALGWSGLRSKAFPVVFESVKGVMLKLKTSTSLCNYDELRAIMLRVKELMFFGLKDRKINQEDIGIISPYKMQCQLIRRELDRRGWYGIETGSVETFQGQEKPIIIASMVRSRVDTPGFLDNPKRLNVLLTRAQALLILIGNPDTLKKIGDWKHVVEYCIENKAFVGAQMSKSVSDDDDDDSDESDSTLVSQSMQDLTIKDDRNVKKHLKGKKKVHTSARQSGEANINIKGRKGGVHKKVSGKRIEKGNQNVNKGEDNGLDWIKWLEELPSVDLFGNSIEKTSVDSDSVNSSNKENVSKPASDSSRSSNTHFKAKTNKKGKNENTARNHVASAERNSVGPRNYQNERNMQNAANKQQFKKVQPHPSERQIPSVYAQKTSTNKPYIGQDLNYGRRQHNSNFSGGDRQFDYFRPQYEASAYANSGSQFQHQPRAPPFHNSDPFAGPANNFRMPPPFPGNNRQYSQASERTPVFPAVQNVSGAKGFGGVNNMKMQTSRLSPANPNRLDDPNVRMYPTVVSASTINQNVGASQYDPNADFNRLHIRNAPPSIGMYPHPNKNVPVSTARTSPADPEEASGYERQRRHNQASLNSYLGTTTKKSKEEGCVLS